MIMKITMTDENNDDNNVDGNVMKLNIFFNKITLTINSNKIRYKEKAK